MVSNVNGSPQNVALEPAAPRPVDPAAEAVQREQSREAIESREAVRRTRQAEPQPAHDERTKHVNRYA